METFVYILYSPSTDSFYIGETSDIEKRLSEHNSHLYVGSHTTVATDWKIYYLIGCPTKKQALFIEKHIKKMKSRKCLNDLKHYPDITKRLLAKYNTNT